MAATGAGVISIQGNLNVIEKSAPLSVVAIDMSSQKMISPLKFTQYSQPTYKTMMVDPDQQHNFVLSQKGHILFQSGYRIPADVNNNVMYINYSVVNPSPSTTPALRVVSSECKTYPAIK